MPLTFVTVASRRFKFGYALKRAIVMPVAGAQQPNEIRRQLSCHSETVSIAYPYLKGRASLLLRQGNWKWSAGTVRFRTYGRSHSTVSKGASTRIPDAPAGFLESCSAISATRRRRSLRPGGRAARSRSSGQARSDRAGMSRDSTAATRSQTQQTRSPRGISEVSAKSVILLAPRAGFEPATIRLTVECSTAELPRNMRTGSATGERITKPPGLAKDEMGRCPAGRADGGKSLRHSDLSAFWTRAGATSGHTQLIGEPIGAAN